MRHEIFSWDRRQKIFSWGAPSNKKISCLTRKSHVSCLLYKSHEKISWDMTLSHETEDRRFSHRGPTPQENLLSHKKISCLMCSWYIPWENLVRHEIISWNRTQEIFSWWPPWISHEMWDFLMRQETGDFLIGGLYKKMSCLMRKSHVLREYLISYQFWAPPNEKISCLLSHEKISCLKRKSHVSREYLISYQFWAPQQENIVSPVSWVNLISHEKLSCLMHSP